MGSAVERDRRGIKAVQLWNISSSYSSYAAFCSCNNYLHVYAIVVFHLYTKSRTHAHVCMYIYVYVYKYIQYNFPT